MPLANENYFGILLKALLMIEMWSGDITNYACPLFGHVSWRDPQF
jgi:hypothetical protein